MSHGRSDEQHADDAVDRFPEVRFGVEREPTPDAPGPDPATEDEMFDRVMRRFPRAGRFP
jgi:hypothetical protein